MISDKMSWFDASGIANIAKSALKEAQKTIDKALDIKDDEQNLVAAPKAPPEDDADGFFASWGVKNSGSNSSSESRNITSPTLEEEAATASGAANNSFWGSFTGSFFEAGAKVDSDKLSTDSGSGTPVSKQPQKSLISLSQNEDEKGQKIWGSPEENTALSDEDISGEKFQQSKLVVADPDSPLEPNSKDIVIVEPIKPPASLSLQSRHNVQPEVATHLPIPTKNESTELKPLGYQGRLDDGIAVIPLRKATSSGGHNRLSVISSTSTGSPDDGGSVGGESVEVLGSTSESSISPESVGVLPGSSSDLTSPSSVEVLGWSEANSPCSPSIPRPGMLFPGQPRSQPPGFPTLVPPPRSASILSSPLSDIISPDSVEIIGEDESEASFADDSSTSASSTTTTTVMEPRTVGPPAEEVASRLVSSSTQEEMSSRLTSSTHMRSMLAEAMEDQSPQSSEHSATQHTREQSPISSESRSEPAKQESEQTSGQTSGDELETTTSSDIEIISSPNGDSSSTHSRHSPAKILGHAARVNLDLLSASPDPGSTLLQRPGPCLELNSAEELLKKLREMSELLEARETKLMELSRVNVELQENNSELHRQLEVGLQSQAANSQDVNQLTEEFTLRLSALEKRFQQAIRDKDALRKQLEQSRLEASSRMATSQLETLMSEKDEVIRELRQEGEKLSKQQLQLSTLIKKLRAKEKEYETSAKSNKQQISDLTQEAERLKKSLSAKEEVERIQIEAVNRLTAQVKRQDKELAALQDEVKEFQGEKDKLQGLLDAANKEVSELRTSQLSSEIVQQQTLAARLEEQQAEAQRERNLHQSELEQLRSQLGTSAEGSTRREEALRRESSAMLRRLTAAEARADELAQAATEATRPLLRQLEALQANASAQQIQAERTERLLSDKLADAQARLASISEQEQTNRDHRVDLLTKVQGLQAEVASLSTSLSKTQEKCKLLQEDKDKSTSALEILRSMNTEEIANLHREVTSLKEQLSVQSAATEAERRHCATLQQELQLQHQQEQNMSKRSENSLTASLQLPSPSVLVPTPPRSSSSPASLAESLLGTSWLQDDSAFMDTTVLGFSSETSGPTSALLEGLQSQLKRREGEASLLRSEARRLELQRAELTRQVAALTAKADSQSTELERLAELEHKYDALLQMYGEQLEANQELRLDLDDVKDMYRAQIETLLSGQEQQASQ